MSVSANARTALGSSRVDLALDLLFFHRLAFDRSHPIHRYKQLADSLLALDRVAKQPLDCRVGEQPQRLGALGDLIRQFHYQFAYPLRRVSWWTGRTVATQKGVRVSNGIVNLAAWVKSDIIRSMKDIRLESMSAPFSESGSGAAAARVIAFAATTGLLENVNVRALDMPTWKMVVKRLRDLGVGRMQGHMASGTRELEGSELSRAIESLYDAIEGSPMPASEWTSMRTLLKDELLERLLGISRPSIQRYATGERHTPQEVADRLHAIALIASDLAGSYNEFGVRRWFDRPRAQLSGKCPSAILKGNWKPDAEPPRKVRALAAVLSGAKAA